MNAEQYSQLKSLHHGLAILEAARDRCRLAADSPAHTDLRELVVAIDGT